MQKVSSKRTITDIRERIFRIWDVDDSQPGLPFPEPALLMRSNIPRVRDGDYLVTLQLEGRRAFLVHSGGALFLVFSLAGAGSKSLTKNCISDSVEIFQVGENLRNLNTGISGEFLLFGTVISGGPDGPCGPDGPDGLSCRFIVQDCAQAGSKVTRHLDLVSRLSAANLVVKALAARSQGPPGSPGIKVCMKRFVPVEHIAALHLVKGVAATGLVFMQRTGAAGAGAQTAGFRWDRVKTVDLRIKISHTAVQAFASKGARDVLFAQLSSETSEFVRFLGDVTKLQGFVCGSVVRCSIGYRLVPLRAFPVETRVGASSVFDVNKTMECYAEDLRFSDLVDALAPTASPTPPPAPA